MAEEKPSSTLADPLIPDESTQINVLEDGSWPGQCSALKSACSVMTITVGIGILSIPYGIKSAGWIGAGYIVLLAIMATASGIMIIEGMQKAVLMNDRPNLPRFRKGYVTYSCVGRAAMGLWGEAFVMLQVHLTLVGVSILFLILGGSFLKGLLHYFFQYELNIRMATLMCGAVASIHSVFKTLRELGILSAFNVLITIYLLVITCIEVFQRHGDHDDDEDYGHELYTFNIDTVTAFSNFAFAFGTHPCLPAIYNSMKRPKMFPWMVSGAFGTICLFYLVVGVVGYWGYGKDVQSPILDNLERSDLRATAELSILLHVLISFGLVLNPTETSLDREVGKFWRRMSPAAASWAQNRLVWSIKRDPANYSPVASDDSAAPEALSLGSANSDLSSDSDFNWYRHISVRLIVTAFSTAVAIYFSAKQNAFQNFLGLMSAITNTFTIFILPALFYAILVLPGVQSAITKFTMVIIITLEIVVGVGSCIIGTYNSIKALFF